VSGPSAGKPKLVFFRWTRPGLPHFIRQHLQEHVRCLEHHFEVVVIDDDCDYAEVCDAHRPDLTLFESGVYAGERRITNTSSCPDVPKLGFCNSDAYCATRSVFLSDMERWGVETFFTLSVAMAEYTPEIADRLFVWPNFVDGDVYRDYGQPKNIPVLFTGSQAAHYPWRSRVHGIVTQRYPSLTTPHGGWFDQQAVGRMVHGSRYATMLNASMVAPTCGTIAREVIRKHFEIPAARTCLVTERTASIEAAGFVDMQNVVFAEPDDIVDKLDHLFANPEELRRITDAGHELVQTRHTMGQRDQILQWLRLHQAAGPGQKIVQSGPFEPLRLSSAPGAGNAHPLSRPVDRKLLREGERLLAVGRHDAAEQRFLRCLNYHFMPEPVLGVARCRLYRGDAAGAASRISETIEGGFVEFHAQDPDPVEWAFFVRALLCQGKVQEAAQRADQFHIAHPELDRIRQVALLLADRAAPATVDRPVRPSVHAILHRDLDAWVDDLVAMLRACGQCRLAEAVAVQAPALDSDRTRTGARMAPEVTGTPVLPLVPQKSLAKIKRRVRGELADRVRKMTANAPQAAVRTLLTKEDVRAALLIGASATARSTRAALAGLRRNPNQPPIYWLRDATPSLLPGRGRRPGERLADGAALAETRAKLHDGFDVVVLGEHSRLDRDEQDVLAKARFLVLTGINRSDTHRFHADLIGHPDYALVTHHDSHDGGYSVFRRVRDRVVITRP
jgi:hypothetical protein